VELKPESIRSLDDLEKIPFTVKNDLRDTYPFGMVATESYEIVEIHASSGTTGNQIIGAYTKNDVDVWQELMARSIYTADGRCQDVIHIAYGYGLCNGGITADVEIVKPGELPRTEGKAKRVLDLRNGEI
jgi:phenylacetate-CoA ligase